MRLHHLGLAVKNIEQTAILYKESLNWEVVSETFLDPVQGVRVLFMKDYNNDILYELIEQVDETSPISGMISKGISLYHICYQTSNIDKRIKSLSEKGFILISQPKKAIAFEGNLIAFLISKDNLIVELLEK